MTKNLYNVYCYERTWAVMALVDSIVVRCTRLDDYNTMYIHLSSRTLTFSIFNVVSFLPLTPRGFVWLHWLGDTFPIFPMWFFGFSYQAAHTFFHCTFWFVGTSSFCWRSSCFGLGWGGPFIRSLLCAVAGVPSPLLTQCSCVFGFPSFICFNLINGDSRGQNIP